MRMENAKEDVKDLRRSVADADCEAVVFRQDLYVVVDKGGVKCRDKKYIWSGTQSPCRREWKRMVRLFIGRDIVLNDFVPFQRVESCEDDAAKEDNKSRHERCDDD